MEGTDNIVIYMECRRKREGLMGFDGCKMFLPEPSVLGGFICSNCGCGRECHRRLELSYEEAVAVDVLLLGFANPAGVSSSSGGSTAAAGKKRARRPRTCFTEEQKRQMMAFSERLGTWSKNRRRKNKNNALKSLCNLLDVRAESVTSWLAKNVHRQLPASPDQQKPDNNNNNNAVIAISSSSSDEEDSLIEQKL